MTNEATKPHGAQDDLRTQCPFCKGIGKRERTQFASAMDMDTNDTPSTYMAQCHECHGNGWVWALTQSEMAERIASQSAELEQLHRDFDALVDHLKDAIGDDLKAHVDPIIGFVDEDLTRAVGAMRTGLEKLRAENARLKAPVTDPEMIALYCHCNPPTLQQMELLRLQARQAYRVIKARAQEPRKESNDASS